MDQSKTPGLGAQCRVGVLQGEQRESPPPRGWGESRALGGATAGFRPFGVERLVTHSPKPIRKHWGPSRRHASHDASSTPAPATRDGVTARPIQPRRRGSLSTVAQRTGRPMARPVSIRASTADGRPMRYRALCERIPCLCRGTQHATPCKGPKYRAQTGVRPRGGSLPPSAGADPRTVLPGAMAAPTPSAGNPTTSFVGGCQSSRSCRSTTMGQSTTRTVSMFRNSTISVPSFEQSISGGSEKYSHCSQ